MDQLCKLYFIDYIVKGIVVNAVSYRQYEDDTTYKHPNRIFIVSDSNYDNTYNHPNINKKKIIKKFTNQIIIVEQNRKIKPQ